MNNPSALSSTARAEDHDSPLRPSAVRPKISGHTVSGCRVLAIIRCGPRPIIADAPASRLTNTATGSASVSGSITPTISPISP